ncbi:MAG: hypothetical protein Q4G61_08395, partial [Tissierellia bacterium]|nr:hypothetical protein [Tissierellia bacterium]
TKPEDPNKLTDPVKPTNTKKPTQKTTTTTSKKSTAGKNPYTYVADYGWHIMALLLTGSAVFVADKKRRKK